MGPHGSVTFTQFPSIDTAMHGLVDAAHVDHLHPDSGIALACAADGEKLTAECFGEKVVWVPWRRPGFQLGLDIAAVKAAHPQAIGCVLGGHGVTTWGDSAEECEANSLFLIRTAETFLAARGTAQSFGAPLRGYEALPEAERRARAAELAPHIRRLASQDRPQVGHFDDSDTVLDFLSRTEHPRLAALGTSCPDHFLRTKVRPLVLDLPPTAELGVVIAQLEELHAAYREECTAYYRRHATEHSPAMRGADPAVVLVPGVGMFSYGKDKQTARVAGEFYLNAINVTRGAEAVSTYAPIEESEKFRIEYWDLEEAKLRRMPAPKPLATRVAFVTGAGSGIGKAIAHRLVAEGVCVVVADLDADNGAAVAQELGGPDKAVAATVDVTCEEQITQAFRAATLAFGGVDLVVNNAGISLSKPLLETTTHDWDRQHATMARGSFLVSREAARIMTAQAWAATSSTSPRRTPPSQDRTTSPTPPPRPTRLTKCGYSPPSWGSTASASTASIRTGWCAARAPSRAAGERSARRRTASRRRSSASSTPSAPCSSARCCPSTSRTPCSR
ncbi:hypothetical protein GCM10010252_73720 [Streptomyces aureoverticillatus]|nr:hypothetical protein GCM10010252_73720 [Streptomyces aureoverticillatus]